jgi:hypothetical protein
VVLPECLASLAAAVVSASCVSWSSHHNSKRKWAHVQMPSFHTQTWTHSQPSLSSSLLLSPKKYIAFFLDFFFFIIFLSLLNHLPVGRQQFIGRHRDISTGTWLHTHDGGECCRCSCSVRPANIPPVAIFPLLLGRCLWLWLSESLSLSLFPRIKQKTKKHGNKLRYGVRARGYTTRAKETDKRPNGNVCIFIYI